MKFEKIVRKSQEELKQYVTNSLVSDGYNVISQDGFVYGEGELPILLVAHLDTVHKNLPGEFFYNKNKDKITCFEGIGGDDRCGVFIIFNIIKLFKCHVLFCEDEEIGGIGASKFTGSGIKPLVNFIIEFDRMGADDAVFYDCDNEDFKQFITSFNFKENYGSFSDICILSPYLGVSSVNLSSGYYNPHTKNEYVSFKDMDHTTARACDIINVAVKDDIFYEWIKYDDKLDAQIYDDYEIIGDRSFNSRDSFFEYPSTNSFSFKNLPIKTLRLVNGWFDVTCNGELFDPDVHGYYIAVDSDNNVYSLDDDYGVAVADTDFNVIDSKNIVTNFYESLPEYNVGEYFIVTYNQLMQLYYEDYR